MNVLVVNAGSSTLKLRLLASDDEVIASRDVQMPGEHVDGEAMSDAISDIRGFEATGHRIVHGGTQFTRSVLVDEEVKARLRSLSGLAPLHQPQALAALETVAQASPHVPAVACFDTAYHAKLPPAAATYAVPAEWRDRYSVRRYGFHGLSHAYAARRAAEMLQRPLEDLRSVTCHLGAGASLAAVRGGRSVDTTMGFTPLEGLMMATRSGTVDPGLLLWLQQSEGLTVEEIADALERRSGLKGIAGTGDMRDVLEAAANGEGKALLAVDLYVHRLSASVAAMAAAMDGLDVLVFTGGVGENAARIRQLTAARLGFLGVDIDLERNSMAMADADISSQKAATRTLVITSREDIQIAREARLVLGNTTPA